MLPFSHSTFTVWKVILWKSEPIQRCSLQESTRRIRVITLVRLDDFNIIQCSFMFSMVSEKKIRNIWCLWKTEKIHLTNFSAEFGCRCWHCHILWISKYFSWVQSKENINSHSRFFTSSQSIFPFSCLCAENKWRRRNNILSIWHDLNTFSSYSQFSTCSQTFA